MRTDKRDRAGGMLFVGYHTLEATAQWHTYMFILTHRYQALHLIRSPYADVETTPGNSVQSGHPSSPSVGTAGPIVQVLVGGLGCVTSSLLRSSIKVGTGPSVAQS